MSTITNALKSMQKGIAKSARRTTRCGLTFPAFIGDIHLPIFHSEATNPFEYIIMNKYNQDILIESCYNSTDD